MGGLSAQLLLSGTRVPLLRIDKSDEKQPRLESSSRDRSSSESIVKVSERNSEQSGVSFKTIVPR